MLADPSHDVAAVLLIADVAEEGCGAPALLLDRAPGLLGRFLDAVHDGHLGTVARKHDRAGAPVADAFGL